MKTRKYIYFLIFGALFGWITYTQAASNNEDTRYFVQTTKGFWKNTFGVRNSFEDGFTADLSDFQLRLAKIAGLKVFPLKKLSILPHEVVAEAPSGSKAQRSTPTNQIPWGVRMIYNSDTKPSGGAKVNVAILDTGVYKDHADLKNRVKECKDFSTVKALIDGKCEDKNGHGTHVAGIIAADGGSDKKGIYGVAPEANIFAYKVCANNGSCWSDDIAVAIHTATDNGAQIINLSLGSDVESSLVTDAIEYAASKEVLVVAAGGNDGPYAGSIDYPAASKNAVSVGAIDSNLEIADWSSRGNNSSTKEFVREEGDMEVAAPGVNVESTWKDGSYSILSGTSMASPHVTGLAAKLWQKDADHPAKATRDLLHTLTHDLDPVGDDNDSGWGLPSL